MTTTIADELYDSLHAIADPEGRIWASQAALAAWLAWDRSRVARALRSLIAAGRLLQDDLFLRLAATDSDREDRAESVAERNRSDPHLYKDKKTESLSHSRENETDFNKNASIIYPKWRPTACEIATHVLCLQGRRFPEPELYFEFLLHKFLIKNDGKPLRSPHQRLQWWVQNEELDLAKFLDWKTALLCRGEPQSEQPAEADSQEQDDTAPETKTTPATERRQRRRATVDAIAALDRAAARVGEALERRQPAARAAEAIEEPDITGQLPAAQQTPAPATPAEAREIDEVVRLTGDGLTVQHWPDAAKRTPPAVIEAEIRRHEAAMAPATVAEIRDALATYVVRTTDLPGDQAALEDAMAATLAGLLEIPRRMFFDAHRRVNDKWHGGKSRMPGVADFRNAVRTELFEAENYRRLLKQGLARLGTAATDFSDSERTRLHREAQARKKAEERDALRRAVERQDAAGRSHGAWPVPPGG